MNSNPIARTPVTFVRGSGAYITEASLPLYRKNSAVTTWIRIGQVAMLILVGLFFALQVNAQEYQFKVLANQGDNTLITSDGSRREHLKVGSLLQEGDRVILSEGSYVGLMHPNGRTMELKTPGEFEIGALSASAGEGSSVASKYANFIINKMAKGEQDIDENYRKYLKVTGAVERSSDNYAIKMIMPNAAEIYNPKALIKWTDVKTDTYVFTVKNMYDEVLFTTETHKNTIRLDLTDKRLNNEKLVILQVSAKDNPNKKSENYGIKRIAPNEAKYIETNLAVLKSTLEEDNALDKLILASFYEDNNLLVDALANYEEAMTTYPTVKEYKLAYDQFVSRHNLLN